MNDEVKMIPIAEIQILNPRHRDKKKFELIVQSIRNLGLKKPIRSACGRRTNRRDRNMTWSAAKGGSRRISRSATRKFRPWWWKSRRRNG